MKIIPFSIRHASLKSADCLKVLLRDSELLSSKYYIKKAIIYSVALFRKFKDLKTSSFSSGLEGDEVTKLF